MLEPVLNFISEPEPRSGATEVDYWTGHVLIALLVSAHRVAMCQPQNSGHLLGIDQVLRPHHGHEKSVQLY